MNSLSTFMTCTINILFLLYILHPTESNIIDCSHTKSCISSTISCDATDDCDIVCNEPNICNYKTFICPTTRNKQCNIYCTDSSCLYTKFDASNSNGIHLKLFLQSDSNQNVWSYGSLYCPPGGDCSIISNNDNIQHNHITALNSNSLNITIFSSSSDSNILYESNVFCPIRDQIYCDINIYNGMLSNANIYTVNTQFLWILCKTDKNCYDTEQISKIYCGEKYIEKCYLISENDFVNCICNHPNNPILSTQYTNKYTSFISTTTIANSNSFWERKTNLYYIIIALSSVILISILVLCGFGVYFKMKILIRSLESEQMRSSNRNIKHKIKAYSYAKKTKHKGNNNHLQITSLVTPVSSYQSGVSTLQLTSNNLFGKDIQIKSSLPPIPPIPVEAPKSEMSNWNVEYDCIDESDGFSYGDRNLQVQSALDLKQSAQISVPGAANFRTIIESDSEANFKMIGIRERGLTDVPNLPLDGNCHGGCDVASQIKNLALSARQNLDDSDANSISASTLNNYRVMNGIHKKNWAIDNAVSHEQSMMLKNGDEEGTNKQNIYINNEQNTEYCSDCGSDSNENYKTGNEGGDMYHAHSNIII